MKLLASLLITMSLAVGALAASTAYLARLSLADERLLGQILSSPAGVVPVNADDAYLSRVKAAQEEAAKAGATRTDSLLSQAELTVDLPPLPKVDTSPTGEAALAKREARNPIARTGDTLTIELLTLLRESGVESVKVKSFELGRWTYGWAFGLAVCGLLAGAWMMRRLARLAGNADQGGEGIAKAPPAKDSLLSAQDGLARLDAELRALPRESEPGRRLAVILERLTSIQEGPLTEFIAARPQLVARMGLSGYASVMDKFAGAERQVNRAWSAAADGYLEESEACLVASAPLLAEAIARVGD